MKEKELEIALNHDNIMTFSDCINTRIAYETVYQEKDKEIEKLKEREKMLQESFSDWKKGIEKERKYWLCERTDCCGRIKDGKKYSSLYQENKRLNNIIEKLEQENAVLKTQVVNKDKYSYGIRVGSDEE